MIDTGEQVTETDEIVGVVMTFTTALPVLLRSCADVALTATCPMPVAVKTPASETLPRFAGVVDHVTVGSNVPVPFRADVHLELSPTWMDPG